MERISCCRVCGNKELTSFFDMGKHPFANSLLKSASQPEKSYPLSLSWCQECNLVQLNHTADPEKLFSEYVWVTATSATAQKHSVTLYENIMRRIKSINGGYVLEVASNDGTFLMPFKNNGHKILGVDPARNIAETANKNGVRTECAFFAEKSAKDIIGKNGYAKVVIARNVLPHVANLHDFVKGLEVAVAKDGIVVIEFHYAKTILEDLHYDSVYHEHLCYYTLKNIEGLLNKNNLFVYDIENSPINAGNLILYIKKGHCDEMDTVNACRYLEESTKTNELERWQNFAKKSNEHRKKLLKIINGLKQNRETIIGYGASARSSTLLNFCGLDSNYISLIADKNSLKHKKYTAGTHIRIDAPEKAIQMNPDCVLILAWNFADEIIEELQKKFNFTGKILIPLPHDPYIKNLIS